ncbi:MAG: gene transfer agent family protein [Pseudomonadota bacterium]
MIKPVAIRINGEERPLRLTLGALAEIEDALGGDIEAMKTRLAAPRIGDILVILQALLKGGGAQMSLEALKAAELDLGEAARAIAETFEALEAPGKTEPPASSAAG